MSLTPFPNPAPNVAEHRHPLLPTPNELAELSRFLGPSIAPTPTGITAMSPDTASTVGTPASGRAYGDHRHQITTNAPGALVRSALNSEGAGTGFVRDDHQHSTATLGWGVMPNRFFSTSAQNTISTGTTTDMTITNTCDVARIYHLHIFTFFLKSAAEGWEFDLMEDGSLLHTIGQSSSFSNSADRPLNATVLYEPATGSRTLALRVTRTTGTGTINLSGTPFVRRMWLVDIGPR